MIDGWQMGTRAARGDSALTDLRRRLAAAVSTLPLHGCSGGVSEMAERLDKMV